MRSIVKSVVILTRDGDHIVCIKPCLRESAWALPRARVRRNEIEESAAQRQIEALFGVSVRTRDFTPLYGYRRFKNGRIEQVTLLDLRLPERTTMRPNLPAKTYGLKVHATLPESLVVHTPFVRHHYRALEALGIWPKTALQQAA